MKKPKNERRRPKPPNIVRLVLIGILTALYVPLLCVVSGAFRQTEGTGVFNWFGEVLRDDVMLAALWNSIIVGLCASLGATILGAGAAIAIHRGRFWGRPLLEVLSYVSLVLPEIVFALALLSW